MSAPRSLSPATGLWRTLGRALRLRCPRCGRTPLFRGWFAMHERCAMCGLQYEREQGYFVGAIYVNYAVTAVVCLGTPIVLDALIGLSLAAQLAIAMSLAALVPVGFFRYSRSLWLAIDTFVTRIDSAATPRRRR